MKFRTTLILLIVAALLGGFIVYSKHYLPTTEELEKRKNKIVDLASKDITGFDLKRGNDIVSCLKDGSDTWRVVVPLNDQADQSVLEMTLREFDYLRKKDVIKPEKGKALNLVDYGLHQPRVAVTLRGGDQKTYTLNIGGETPLGNGVYLQLAGDADVYVVDKDFFAAVNKTLFDLRSKDIFELDLYDVDQLQLIYPGRAFTLVKKNEVWGATEPVKDKADQEQARNYLVSLNNLRVESFVEEKAADLTKYGLDRPSLKVAVSKTGSGETETLSFGLPDAQNADRVYLMKEGSPRVVTVAAGVFDELKLNLDDLRLKKIFDFDENALKLIEIRKNDQPVVSLEKKNNNWEIIHPPSGFFSAFSIREFVDKLNNQEVHEFTDEGPTDLNDYGLSRPALTLVLASEGGPAEWRMDFGMGPSGKLVYARKSDEKRVVAFRKDFFDWLGKGYLLFQNKSVLTVARDQIKTVLIARADGRKFKARQEKAGNWLVLEPSGTAPENLSDFYAILDRVCFLRTNEFISGPPVDQPKYGLDQPWLKVSLTFSEGGQKMDRTLLVGNELSDGARYGQMTDRPFVFLIHPRIVKSFQKNIIKK